MTPPHAAVYVPPAYAPNWHRFTGHSALGPLIPEFHTPVIDTAALVQALKAFGSKNLK